MKRLAFTLGWILALASSARAQSPSYRLADNIFTRFEDAFGPPQTPHPAVVRVIAPEDDGVSLGSGTLIEVNETHGLVVTNWHVVRDSTGEVWVVFPDGFRSPGYVLKTDESWDLAAVAVQKPKVAPVVIATQPAKPGDSLTIHGYGRGKYRSAGGECTQYVAPDTQSPFEMVEVAVTARQGDSGGPILNDKGELAGVLFGAGGGRTAGSYCGRVHRFLASMQVTPAQRSAMLAAVPPRGDAATMPTDRVAVSSTFTQAPPPAVESRPLVEFTSVEQPAWKSSERVATAQEYFSPPSTEGAPPSWLTNSSALTPRSEEPSPSIAFDWRSIAGQSQTEQIKTALATVGVLALVLHGLRWLRTG